MSASDKSTFFEPPTEDHNGAVLKREGQSHLCDSFTVLLTSRTSVTSLTKSGRRWVLATPLPCRSVALGTAHLWAF